jgi:hypothetical protein
MTIFHFFLYLSRQMQQLYVNLSWLFAMAYTQFNQLYIAIAYCKSIK